MDTFLKRVRPSIEPQTSPSGGVPEEGIAVTEDSSICAVAPVDLPVVRAERGGNRH